MATNTKKKTRKRKTNPSEHPLWGGKREGAGSKPKYGEEPLSSRLSMRVRTKTRERVDQLRELTKNDAMPFNQMFESWVADLAGDYGLD